MAREARGAPKPSERIYTIFRDLSEYSLNSQGYRTTLEERLPIAFAAVHRPPRSRNNPRPLQEIQLTARHKKAREVYLRILEEDPHAFLPFVIAISPRSCQQSVISEFRSSHPKLDKLRFSRDVETFLEGISSKHHFNNSTQFKYLLASLFPPRKYKSLGDSLPLPLTYKLSVPLPKTEFTLATSSFESFSLGAIHTIFGNGIGSAVMRVSERMREQSTTTMKSMTDRVRMCLWRHSRRDPLIFLDVEPASEFSRILFPEATSTIDGHRTLGRASILAVSLLFDGRIYNAIESSDRRAMENSSVHSEFTDCVSLEVQEGYGTLCLTIGLSEGTKILQDLLNGR